MEKFCYNARFTILAGAWCLATFSAAYLLGEVFESGRNVFMFWAGILYIAGVQLMPDNAAISPPRDKV
jgi:hypothetical protein